MKFAQIAFGVVIVMSMLGPHPLAQNSPDAARKAPEKYLLPNGLEVILAEDHRLPVVAVNIWYHVGPANEEAGRTGFAHLFEHMMFQGSRHVPGNSHFRLLELAGESSVNGTTDFDRTNYFETVPSNQLELALWLESDRMGYLLDTLDQAKLSNQQDVVRNERREGENRPYGIVEETVYHELFPPAHPYYANVIGSHADIQAAKLEDVRKFFRLYYVPNNASLAIAGDFDPDMARKMVAKYFGSFQRGGPVPKIKASTPPVRSERRKIVRDRVQLERVDMAWITPAIFQPGDAEAALAARILGGGKSSRLYKKLVYEKQIAQEVAVEYQGLALGSVFHVHATARPGHTASELAPAIDEVIEQFRQEGPGANELEGARNFIETNLMQRLERVGGLADRLNYYNHYLGRPDFLAHDLARYQKATPAGVRGFAQDQLRSSARTVIQCLPGTPEWGPDVPAPAADLQKGAEMPANGHDEPWRSEIPKAGPARPLKIPAPQSFTLPNGLTIIHDERRGGALVSARLVVRAGGDANPLDKPGLASFTAAMLDEGTTSRSAMQISEEAERLGATLSTASSMDDSSASIKALQRNFPAALALLADIVLHPSFPPEEIARQRAIRLGMIVQRRSNPARVADEVTTAVLYGSHHPYGLPELGTESSIQAIDRADLAAFWKKSFTPKNAALVVAGAISLGELKGLAEKEFGAWQADSTGRPQLDTPPAPVSRIVVVDKPGAQTQLRVAMVGVPRSTPDYAALEILNASLAGIFSSRINMNLREEKGYTYGAHSAFSYRRFAGPFVIRAGVRIDATAPSVTEVFKEVRRIADSRLSADELRLAKDSQVLSLPGKFETTDQAVNSFSSAFVYNLGLDYYARLPGLLSGVDASMVQAMAQKYLRSEKMVVVAVGDRAKIEPALAKLGLGTVEIRDAEGQLKSGK